MIRSVESGKGRKRTDLGAQSFFRWGNRGPHMVETKKGKVCEGVGGALRWSAAAGEEEDGGGGGK